MNTRSLSNSTPLFCGAIFLLAAVTSVMLSGCGAVYTAVKKRNLDVETEMSDSVYLDPVSRSKRSIYVSIHNTSDKDIEIKSRILSALQENGYKVVLDPQKAHYMLQANILRCSKSDRRTANLALEAGFGGGVTAAALAYAAGGGPRSAAGFGVLGATLATVGDAMVEDTVYSMITDLQIRERPLKGEVITQTQHADIKQGTSTSVRQDVRGAQAGWKTYRTRIVSTAEKVNLDFATAQPSLEQGLVRSISGVFVE